jgi:hypothetical protein
MRWIEAQAVLPNGRGFSITCASHRHIPRVGSDGSWQTRQGRALVRSARPHRLPKPGGCGLAMPPPPTAAVAWQVAQSRSTWQLTQALMLRSASHAW